MAAQQQQQQRAQQSNVALYILAAIAVYAAADTLLSKLIMSAIEAEVAWTATEVQLAVKQVRQIVQALDNQALPTVQKAVTLGYAEGVASVNALYPQVSAQLDSPQLTQLLADTEERLTSIHQEIGQRASEVISKESQIIAPAAKDAEALSKHVADALERENLTTSVRRTTQGVVHLVNVVPIKGSDGKTRNFSAQSYAQLVARTAAVQAHSQAVSSNIVQAQAAGTIKNDLVTVSDNGTHDKLCGPWAGRTFSLTGKTKGYPVLKVLPPFHPQCVHYLIPGDHL